MVPLSLVALAGRTELVFRATRPPQTALRSQAHTRRSGTADNFPAEPRSELPLRRIRRTNWAAMQAYVLIGIFMRRARRTTFGMCGNWIGPGSTIQCLLSAGGRSRGVRW